MNKPPTLIILAAGNSKRMGFPKGLLDYHGKPWILEQISRFKCVKNPKVILVLGNDINVYFEQIDWFSKALNTFYNFNGIQVKILHNKQTNLGSFSSLKLALSYLDKEESVLVQPIDVPLLDEYNLKRLIEENNTIVIPNCDLKNGHPVLLKPLFWNQLLAIDTSLKSTRLDYLIKNFDSEKIIYLKVDNSLIHHNMNTWDAWSRFINNESTVK